MDKEGRYEGSNKADHRALELGIDVLLFQYYTRSSGHAIEASYAGMDDFIRGFNNLSYSNFILEYFADFIKTLYLYQVRSNEIKGWVTGLSRLFCLSTGKWPNWFRRLDNNGYYVFRKFEDLYGRENNYLVLTKPKYWSRNFLNAQLIHLFNDCLPRFNILMKSFLDLEYLIIVSLIFLKFIQI
jgi:hypothetical protein